MTSTSPLLGSRGSSLSSFTFDEDPRPVKKWWIYSLLFKQPTPPFPKVSNQEFLSMGEFRRWKNYGIVPWKTIVQVLVISLFIIQVFFSNANGFYENDMTDALYNRFTLGTVGGPFTSLHREIATKYYAPQDVLHDIAQFSTNFHTRLPVDTLGMEIHIQQNASREFVAPVLTRSFYNRTALSALTGGSQGVFQQEHQQTTPTVKAPFGDFPVCYDDRKNPTCNELNREFFATLASLSISYELLTHVYSPRNHVMECYSWTFQFKFEYSYHRAALDMHSNHQIQYCDGYSFTNEAPALDYIVAILAFWSICISVRALVRPFLFCQQYAEQDPRFASESFHHKLAFATRVPISSKSRGWHVLTILASSATFIYSSFRIFGELNDSYDHDELIRIWMGIAAFLNALCLPQYFYKIFVVQHYQTILQTIYQAIPQIIRVIVCFLPVMMAYVIVGTLMFGKTSSRFKTIGQSWITLFSLANGDEIHETIKTLYHDSTTLGMLGAAFLMSYMVIFIYVVLTIIISIMERAYRETAELHEAQSKQQMQAKQEPVESRIKHFLRSSSIVESKDDYYLGSPDHHLTKQNS